MIDSKHIHVYTENLSCIQKSYFTAQIDFIKMWKISCRLWSVAINTADYINLKIFLPVSF